MSETVLRGDGAERHPDRVFSEIKPEDKVAFRYGNGDDLVGTVTADVGFDREKGESRLEVCFVLEKPGGGSKEIKGVFLEGRLKKVFPETASLH